MRKDIKKSKSQIRRKFDKTYKNLSLQLDQDLDSFDINPKAGGAFSSTNSNL